jgi:hypothetical protein
MKRATLVVLVILCFLGATIAAAGGSPNDDRWSISSPSSVPWADKVALDKANIIAADYLTSSQQNVFTRPHSQLHGNGWSLTPTPAQPHPSHHHELRHDNMT